MYQNIFYYILYLRQCSSPVKLNSKLKHLLSNSHIHVPVVNYELKLMCVKLLQFIRNEANKPYLP